MANALTLEEKSFDLRKFFLRVLQYWPYFLLAVLLSVGIGFLYLRYKLPSYKISSRLVVNDDSQESGSNILESLNASFRNVDKGTEREIEILKSKTLIVKVVEKLKLNVEWYGEGRVRRQPLYGQSIPLLIEFEDPYSINIPIKGEIVPKGDNAVMFNETEFELGKWGETKQGKIKFTRMGGIDSDIHYSVSILPINLAANIIKNTISVQQITNQSTIVDISIVDAVQQRGIDIVQTLISEYEKNNIEFKNRIYENTLKFVDERLSFISFELQDVETDMQSIKSKQGIFDLSEQGRLYLSQVKEIDDKISQIEIEQEVLKEIELYVSNRNKSGTNIPSSLGLSDPVLINLLVKLFQSESDLEKMRSLSGELNPELRVLESSIENLKRSILQSISNLRNSNAAKVVALRSDLRKYESLLKSIPDKEKRLLEIGRQQQIKNNIYTFLLQKREEAALSAAVQVPTHRLIDKAESLGVVSPIPVKVFGILLVMFLGATSILIYFIEFENSKILFKEDIEKNGQLPVIGELVQSEQTITPLVVAESARSIIAEQVREIRTNLSFIHSRTSAKVLLFTSSIPGEGKTFLSMNLAASLAQAGKKVALLEFDLRKPKISQYLSVNKSPGLSSYLINSADISDITRKVGDFENFFLIPSGPIPPNPAELIMNGRTENLFNELREHFDFILVDAPPIGSVTDAKLLGKYSDATIYLMRYKFTPKEFIDYAIRLKNSGSLPNLNVVLNGVRNKGPFGYGYGYGRGYGYSYGYGYTDEDSGGGRKSFISRVVKLFKG